MRDDLTQAELDEIFYGKPPTVVARFYTERVTDVPASRAAGERMFKDQVMIHLKCEKERTETNRPAQAQDKKQFHQEWLAFQMEEQQDELPGQVQDLRSERAKTGTG